MAKGVRKHRGRRRKPLPLPYNNRPVIGAVRFDPSLHTAAELMSSAHNDAA